VSSRSDEKGAEDARSAGSHKMFCFQLAISLLVERRRSKE